jgi:hypothetical protein
MTFHSKIAANVIKTYGECGMRVQEGYAIVIAMVTCHAL